MSALPAPVVTQFKHTANANNATFWFRELIKWTISTAASRGLEDRGISHARHPVGAAFPTHALPFLELTRSATSRFRARLGS